MRNTPTQKLVKISTGREVEDVLRELYVDRRYNKSEVGRALGVSRETVRLWLLEYGIERDPEPPTLIAA